MTKKEEKKVEEVSEEVVVQEAQVEQNTTVHLDRDPNDPRNRPETKALPSLDD